jgi:hypothetical protein
VALIDSFTHLSIMVNHLVQPMVNHTHFIGYGLLELPMEP